MTHAPFSSADPRKQIPFRNTWSEGGGSMLGVGLRANTYGAGASGNSADSLNRYASIVRPQYFNVTGQRTSGAMILINGGTPTYQQGASGLYFRKEVAANASGRYTATTVTANGATTDTWNQYVAPTPEPYTYDADGNLLSDSRWTYTWDAENRLTSATSQPQANPPLAVNGVQDNCRHPLFYLNDRNSRAWSRTGRS
jgi:hypothetical protein